MNLRDRATKWCPRCEIEKPRDGFARHNGRYDGLQSHCKACGVVARRTTQRSSDLKRKFGITAEEWDAMYEAQDGKCLVCDRLRKLVVDHSHHTGQVRGLLCSNCNAGLGMFEENIAFLRGAMTYLQAEVDEITTSGDTRSTSLEEAGGLTQADPRLRYTT